LLGSVIAGLAQMAHKKGLKGYSTLFAIGHERQREAAPILNCGQIHGAIGT
jgi:hypothetical protein